MPTMMQDSTVARKRKSKLDPAFSRKLYALRKRARLTQAALAHKAGLQTMTISNLERPAVLPSVETVFKLAAALNVPAEELFALLRPKG
jgi:DNA-binding XRE family transcriptional regulator